MEEKKEREKNIMDTLVMLYNHQYGTNLTYKIANSPEEIKLNSEGNQLLGAVITNTK